jgi:dynamin 1-like protein
MASEEMAGSFYDNLRSLISLVDNLRDAGLQKYIKLPRIAVLGT